MNAPKLSLDEIESGLRSIARMCHLSIATERQITELADAISAHARQASEDAKMLDWLEKYAQDYRDRSFALIASEAPSQTPGWKYFVKEHRGESLREALRAAMRENPQR